MANEPLFAAFVEKLRAILLQDWDPIGIGEVECMADEYDGYLSDLLQLVEDDACVADDFTNLLLSIERENMALAGNVSRAHSAAEKIMQLIQQLDIELAKIQ